MSKNRTEVPDKTAAELQFLSNRSCCICREARRAIQIHHIDENPSNHEIDNLALLCFECHNDTQLRGGFGRKLDAEQVVKFRNDWHKCVEAERSQLRPEIKQASKNATLEHLKRTLNEIEAIQSRRQCIGESGTGLHLSEAEREILSQCAETGELRIIGVDGFGKWLRAGKKDFLSRATQLFRRAIWMRSSHSPSADTHVTKLACFIA